MRNIIKKSLLIAVSCFIATITWAQVQSFTAAEIKAGTTKGTVSVSTPLSIVNKQMCKENGKGVKIDAVEGGSTANTVNDNYVQISATSDITKLVLHATYNSSGSGKKMAFVYWGDGVTPAIDNVLSAELVTFVGYDGACDQNYTEVTLPTGVRTIRIYRQLKKFDGTGSASGNYGDGTTFFIADVDVTAGPAPKSNDATLSDLKVDGTTIEGFAPATTTYNYSVAATATVAPVISATKNDTKASDPVISQPTLPTAGSPTTGTVKVTAEDGETSLTYTITFTRAELSHDATLKDIKVDGKSISGFSPSVTSYTVDIPFSQTTIPEVTATVNSNGAKAEVTPASTVEGTASILVTAEDGSTQKTYTLTFQKVAASTDATLSDLKYDGKTVNGFNATKTSYSVELPEGSAVPVVSATTTHPFAETAITQATSTSGTAEVEVTAEDGATKKTYTITFSEVEGVPVPPTSLLIHTPGKYEDNKGYATPLTVLNGHEYEVYYTERTADGDYPTFSTTLVSEGKATGISGSTTTSKNVGTPGDTWFEGTIYSQSECKYASAKDEFKFEAKAIREHRLSASDTYQFHVKGYDQFTLWGMDKKLDPKNGNQVFVVKVDGVEQPTDASLYNVSNYTIRRYDISAGEHLIEISTTCTGTNVCYMGGVSLRVAQQPRVMHIKGNDSTQTVLQTQAIRPITYYTKYNSFGETKIVWEGQEATGLSLNKVGESSVGDTLVLSGNANCPAGVYTFHIASIFNGKETESLPVKLTIKSQIEAYGVTECEAYQGEEMDQLKFTYYALSGDDVTLNWTNNNPGGITGSGQDGLYLIGGVPQNTGTFDFTVSVKDGNSINGKLIVNEAVAGDVLYLYKNNDAFKDDGIYQYLAKKYAIATRKAKEDGLRSADQYAKYKWIIISEDANADNKEVLAITRSGGANLPVLNMKSFSYAPGRLDWGEPNNGSLTDNARSITVEREDHPIFKAMNKKHGDKIQVLSSIDRKGLMPTAVKLQGSLCLATALTRDINDYNGDGEWQTFLHEIPADNRGGKKYICLPIARSSSKNLTTEGLKLIDAVVDYLLNDEPTVDIPTLQITEFTIDGTKGEINQARNTIHFEIDLTQHPELDLKAVQPTVQVADNVYTHVIPSKDEVIDFSASMLAPVEYVVTDYINRRVYEVTVHTFSSEGLEEVYSVGEWVNIYDIYGRKIATTNENIYTMSLPRGVYLIVNEQGKTAKILK